MYFKVPHGVPHYSNTVIHCYAWLPSCVSSARMHQTIWLFCAGARGGLAVGAGAVHAGGGAAGPPPRPVRPRGAHAPGGRAQHNNTMSCMQQKLVGRSGCMHGADFQCANCKGLPIKCCRASTSRRCGRSTTGCGSCGGTPTTTRGRWPSAPLRRCWPGASSRMQTPGALPAAPCC